MSVYEQQYELVKNGMKCRVCHSDLKPVEFIWWENVVNDKVAVAAICSNEKCRYRYVFNVGREIPTFVL